MKTLKNLAKRILRKEIEQDLLQKKDLEFEVSELKKQVHYLRKGNIELSKSVWQEILYCLPDCKRFQANNLHDCELNSLKQHKVSKSRETTLSFRPLKLTESQSGGLEVTVKTYGKVWVKIIIPIGTTESKYGQDALSVDMIYWNLTKYNIRLLEDEDFEVLVDFITSAFNLFR